ncbi:MAG TPA: hypothetical protein VHM24_12845 [Gemmatimonadaceae bacterium]|nr:hypothetical protein [Gemmatimonadaceae bacterium]
MRSRTVRMVAIAATLAALAACASAGGAPAESADQSGTAGQQSVPPANWPVRTREHVDLWLHGFAMIQDDTSQVPFFRRGYKAEMQDLKRRSNVTTQLDANVGTLRNRLALNSSLVNAQFLPFYFGSLDDMLRALDIFERADGNPRAAGDRETAELIALLAGYFPLPADRDWARLLAQSLRDENSRFYRTYWDQQQRERSVVLTEVERIWQNTYKPRFQRFLNNTRQRGGEILLSLPLDGEGRTLSEGTQQNSTAVTFPMRTSDAAEAIYVIAHELVGSEVRTAVEDNVTPTDRRAGLLDRYVAAGAVRGGLILLQKVAPELVDGYARYYLKSANRSAGSNPVASMASAFALPDQIRDAIARQIDVVLGGI